MEIVIGIPTGQRIRQAVEIINAWQAQGVKIAVRTWDLNTYNKIAGLADYLFCISNIQSYAKNHNFIASHLNWDVYICGADDLWPVDISQLEQICRQNPDKVIWPADGLFNKLNTHPVITRGWYDKYHYIFDQRFRHNFCDNDLMVRCGQAAEMIKCFDIKFDHRHYLKTGDKPDEIYQIGLNSYEEDKQRFTAKYADCG